VRRPRRLLLLLLIACLAGIGFVVPLWMSPSTDGRTSAAPAGPPSGDARDAPELTASPAASLAVAVRPPNSGGSSMTGIASRVIETFSISFLDGAAASGAWIRLIAVSGMNASTVVQLAAGRVGDDGRLYLPVAQARAFHASTGSGGQWTYALRADVLAARDVEHELQAVPAAGDHVTFPHCDFRSLEFSLAWDDGPDVAEPALVFGRTPLRPATPARSLSSGDSMGGLYRMVVAMGSREEIEVRASTLSGSGSSPWVSIAPQRVAHPLRLVLTRGLACRGWLVDQRADPVKGALLTATLHFSDGTLAPAGQRIATDDAGEFRFYLGESPARRLEQVQLRLAGSEEGGIVVDAPRVQSGVIELGRITLFPAEQAAEILLVDGLVRGPRERAMRRATFQVSEPDGTAISSRAEYHEDTGRFEIRGRTNASTLGILVTSPGFQPFASTFATGSRGVAVELFEGSTIAGRVLLDDASLVTSLILRVTCNGRTLTSVDLPPSRFEVPGLPPNPVEVEILLRPLGWVLYRETMSPRDAGTDVVIDLRRMITVVSVSLTGSPAAELPESVVTLVGNGDTRALLRIDETGRVTFPAARVDKGLILVTSDGYKRTITLDSDRLVHSETIDVSK
jgi:hypothetical protein